MKLRQPSVAVVVISHNYGRFLAECLESVLDQTHPAQEIIVINDSSTDDTGAVASRFAERGVLYQRVDFGNVHHSREAGTRATQSDFICFLDADDCLSQDYLEAGLREFQSESVGLVYSNVTSFGNRCERRTYRPQFCRDQLQRDNYIHAGSLVRREALNQSRGFEKQIDPIRTQADWFVWRHVLQPPWIARKQPATYFHRQHGRTWIDGMRRVNSSYFEYAGLAHEPLTLAIPLSGRESLWPRMEDFLNRQTWPHDQTQLVLLDTSHSQQFGRTVRGWLLECDYPDVRYLQESVSRPGLADADRHRVDVQQQVRAAMVRIYSRLAREVTTNYVWILEDDVLPPLDACQRLLEGFDPETASVSAVYDSRYDGQPCVWNERIRHYEQRGIGVEQVHGNGFGCVVLRGEMFRQAIFSENEDFDRSFYRSVKSAGLHAKVDWNCQAEHGELKKSTGVPRQGK